MWLKPVILNDYRQKSKKDTLVANLVNFESSPILGTMLAVKKTSMVSFYLNFLLFSITVADEENMPR